MSKECTYPNGPCKDNPNCDGCDCDPVSTAHNSSSTQPGQVGVERLVDQPAKRVNLDSTDSSAGPIDRPQESIEKSGGFVECPRCHYLFIDIVDFIKHVGEAH